MSDNQTTTPTREDLIKYINVLAAAHTRWLAGYATIDELSGNITALTNRVRKP